MPLLYHIQDKFGIEIIVPSDIIIQKGENQKCITNHLLSVSKCISRSLSMVFCFTMHVIKQCSFLVHPSYYQYNTIARPLLLGYLT
jgi:glutaminase